MAKKKQKHTPHTAFKKMEKAVTALRSALQIKKRKADRWEKRRRNN